MISTCDPDGVDVRTSLPRIDATLSLSDLGPTFRAVNSAKSYRPTNGNPRPSSMPSGVRLDFSYVHATLTF